MEKENGHSCNGDCDHCSHAAEERDAEDCRIRRNLADVKNTVVVLSGKGGVGKSTVAANVAAALARRGRAVGLLDVDLHGPSAVGLFGLEGQSLLATEGGKLLPPVAACGVRVVSVGNAVDDPEAAIVWRGPMKLGVIRQFLGQTEWGALDWLVVDAPPGTGDEPLAVCQTVPDPLGAVVVTTPQRIAAADVARSLAFCDQLAVPIIGIVENMAGFVCPHCGKQVDIFPGGAAEALSKKFDAPVLARIPIDPRISASGDAGSPLAALRPDGGPVSAAFEALTDALEAEAAARAKGTDGAC